MRRVAVSPFVILLTAASYLLGTGASGPALGQTNPTPGFLAGDGAWCWFGNPRAVFRGGRVFFGYVRAGDGRVCLNAFDPATGQSTLLWASDMSQRDDHDNPGLLELSDGRLLAIYAKHGNEARFYYRLSTNSSAHLPTSWTRELVFTNTTAGVTYANPYQLSAEGGRVYNFMRNLNFNPTWVESDETATNWSAPRILIRAGTGGYRPYVQYCSDFQRRIDLTYTDGHPDVVAVPTSLYHFYYQEGALWQTDGSFLKNLADAPVLHDSGERGSVIYQYSTAPSSDPNDHIPYGRAWSWDLAYHTNGAPVAAFTVQLTNVMGGTWQDDRIYYYYARWTGSEWRKRFIAHAGRPLYNTQRYYAGGISLDPSNPDVVYISSNAESPFAIGNVNNVPLRANDRYEIYRGVTADGGLSFTWQNITTNSVMDNLRPYVPRGNPYPVGVIWFAGAYLTYTDWYTSVYGLFGTNVVPVTIQPNAPPAVWLDSPAPMLVFTNLANRLRVLATVADDGHPAPLTCSWETVSGPVPAAFEDSTAPSTSVSFPTAGEYWLRLTASDSLRSSSVDAMVLAGGQGQPPTDPSLALWLPLDETSGSITPDRSGNARDGSVVGTPSWTAAGFRDRALEFNGATFVSVPDAPELDNVSAFTLAWAMRANAYTVGGAGLVSKRNAISDNNAYTTFLQVDGLVNVDIDGNNNRFTSVSTIQPGDWYHVAVTFDGSLPSSERARIYVNGRLERTATETSAVVPNYNSTLKVGLTHSNATTYFNGTLDDIRFYRRALAPSEIISLAAVALAPSARVDAVSGVTNRTPATLAGAVSDDARQGPLTASWSMASGPGSVDFASPYSSSTLATFNRAGEYVVRLAASNATAQVFADLQVLVQRNPAVFEDWVALTWPGETDPAVIGEGADPEGDGVLNLGEFALGLDATLPDAQPSTAAEPGLPVGALRVFPEGRYLAVELRRPAGLLDLLYSVESSADLVLWQAAVFVRSATNADGSETLLFRDTMEFDAGQPRYLRTRIQKTDYTRYLK